MDLIVEIETNGVSLIIATDYKPPRTSTWLQRISPRNYYDFKGFNSNSGNQIKGNSFTWGF